MTLFHFTDPRNLPSISQNGLLSWDRLVRRGIPHWPASSDQSRMLDGRLNLQDYVRLCLARNHPMASLAVYEGRIAEYVWIEIDDVVIRWQSTLFSSENAVARRSIINSDPRTAFESPSIQAEVLVHGRIDQRWLRFP